VTSGAINGAAINALLINGEGGDSGRDVQLKVQGLDLVAHGSSQLVVQVQTAEGELALEFGAASVAATLLPAGLDLATTGTAVARFNTALKPAGLELCSAAPALVVCPVTAAGMHPMEIGSHLVRLGVDVALGTDGLELARTGLHMAQGGMLPEDISVGAAGAAPMEFGKVRVGAGHVEVSVAEGLVALALGAVSTRLIAKAGAASGALEVGSPSSVAVAVARGYRAGDVGSPRALAGIKIPGLDLATSSAAVASTQGVTVEVAAAESLQLGDLQTLGQFALTRQHLPHELGRVSVMGGWVC
jgi:hypothetical protein